MQLSKRQETKSWDQKNAAGTEAKTLGLTAKKAGYARHPMQNSDADRWAVSQEYRQIVVGRACGKF